MGTGDRRQADGVGGHRGKVPSGAGRAAAPSASFPPSAPRGKVHVQGLAGGTAGVGAGVRDPPGGIGRRVGV